MFYTQSVFSSLHFIPSPYFIPSPQSVVHSPSFILTAYTTWKTNCHQFNICWWKLLNCTNLMLENTLQLSLWRHVLNFIIVAKTLSTLFISTIIIIIIIIVQPMLTSTTLLVLASLNNIVNSTTYMFKGIPTNDSQFSQLLKCFECLYLYILFFAYFYFTKICERLVTFCF